MGNYGFIGSGVVTCVNSCLWFPIEWTNILISSDSQYQWGKKCIFLRNVTGAQTVNDILCNYLINNVSQIKNRSISVITYSYA